MKYASTKSFLAHQSPAGVWLSPAHLDSSRLNSFDSQCMKSCALGFLVIDDHHIPDMPVLLGQIIRDSSGLAQEIHPTENTLGHQGEISVMCEIATSPVSWPWSVVLMEEDIFLSPWPLFPADVLLREKRQGQWSTEATWGQERATKLNYLFTISESWWNCYNTNHTLKSHSPSCQVIEWGWRCRGVRLPHRVKSQYI